MVYKDLRQFMQALETTGDILKVGQEVDWDLEAGAINRWFYEQAGPAVHFEKLKDYESGYSIFAGSLGTYRRVAIAMGLPPETSIRDLYHEYERRLHNPIDPIIVSTGPCKENILLGDDIDVFRFPAPMIHDGDGGRYIGTWDLVVCRDPDSDWMNWGMYRFMVHDRDVLAGFPLPTSHMGALLLNKYVPRNQPMPMALVIGADPLCHMAALSTYKMGLSEASLAGGLRRKPVELVKCETNDLLVPANAEIVIEGQILPNVTIPEGPFGEYSGYRTGKVTGGEYCKITAITYRTNPILTMISLGMPPDDNAVTVSMTAAITIKERLQRHNIPVTDVYVPAEGAVFTVVVGVEKGGKDMVRRILEVLTERRVFASKIIVVDKDVDPFDMKQVIHAFSVKCHPGRGIFVTEYPGRGNPITPCFSEEEREKLEGATAIFDCTWPLEWEPGEIPIKSSFLDIYPKSIQEKVLRDWGAVSK